MIASIPACRASEDITDIALLQSRQGLADAWTPSGLYVFTAQFRNRVSMALAFAKAATRSVKASSFEAGMA